MARSYIMNGTKIYVKVPYVDRELAKSVKGYWWHGDKKSWSYPLNGQTIEDLNRVFGLGIMEIQYGQKEWTDKEVKPTTPLPPQFESNEGVTLDDLAVQKREQIKIVEFESAIDPYEHQKYAVTQALRYRKYAFFMEMATGKTKVMIDLFKILKDNDAIDCMLVILPKPVALSWVEEAEKHGCSVSVMYGNKQQRLRKFDPKGINILNYAGAYSLKKELGRFNDKRICIVLDESSKIKNPGAKRTQLMINVFTQNIFKYILTGTPITQNPIDIFSQYQFLDPKIFSMDSWYAFRGRYCITEQGYGSTGKAFYKIVGYKNLRELRDIIHQHAFILKKKDCAEIDLPDKVYNKRTLEMKGEIFEQYKEMRDNLMLEISEDKTITAPIILTKLLRLQQILSGAWLTSQKDNIKLKELMHVIGDFSGNQKVVVWCRFIDSIKLIAEALDDADIGHVLYHGAVKDKDGAIQEFRNNPECKVFVGNLQIGEMGLNLQCASFVVYFENNFSLLSRLQSEDRCHRPGQKNNVTYVDLLYENSIDEDIIEAIKQKKKIADYLVGGLKG